MDQHGSLESEGSVKLQISELCRLGDACSSGTTIFEPRSSIEKRDSSNGESVSPAKPAAFHAPEKKLTLFALRLAVFEKAATGLGTLGFIWATVVLLGGFAITLDKTDFWFITIILLIEGTRIFSRSHELEWQHQATWSIAGVGINSFRALKSSSHSLVKSLKAVFRPISSAVQKRSQQSREIAAQIAGSPNTNGIHRKPTRMWTSSDVPFLPYGKWVFLSRNVSKLLYWLQLLSATACVVLSLMKLIKHNYGEVAKGDTDKRNRKAALTIFYSLALAEALLFLMEKAYWELKVSFCKLLEEVTRECELKKSGLIAVRRFFYDSYSRCVNGSIFDGLGMDMITFSTELLDSNSPDEQLIGVRILCQFATNSRFSDDTLRKIGTNISVIERLVEMLNWKDPQEEEIRWSSAEILSKLAGKKRNALRVAGIAGAMESISSLLETSRSSTASPDEIAEKRVVSLSAASDGHASYGFDTFNHLGLLILKKLARDHDNCGKIGNTRGLLPKIIDLTHADERVLRDASVASSRVLTVKRSLQVVRILASTAGATGKQLRREISEIVFAIGNIREILRHGERYPSMQRLGIEILTSLALEEDATERIGGTGGLLKELLRIFLDGGGEEARGAEEEEEEGRRARVAAGEAMAMLVLESESNCRRVLKLGALERLVGALDAQLLRVNAARILRNLCAFGGDGCFEKLRGATAAAPTVLKAIMSEENKPQEVMIGLASQVFKYMTSEESSAVFERAGIRETELADTLVQILRKYRYPPIKVPRIRRFAIELAIWMMTDKETNVLTFKDLEMERELEHVLETTSEVESFNIFSGTVGVSRHHMTIHSLVELALKLLAEG
ncbi:uncharacterized protein LOC115744913 [Rhodamnia argentea]|uniref:Uncharacterized protein LOC115744913 n=1 Tax=Rhodamnia argentea TaxID=178133 RepID=A0A8B8PPN1_9MYRT|nr:uncharacterized protein LOC115744913 [Rhodamnia argentea]